MVDNIENLLKPRYKVIADYPNTVWKMHQIIDAEKERHLGYWDRYPHLFKKLEWWEERKPEEMPQYMKDIADNWIFKVDKHFYNARYSMEEFKPDDNHFMVGKTACNYHDFLPATEEEYNNQKLKQKPHE